MIKDVLLSEKNKRIEEKNKLLDAKQKQLKTINDNLDKTIELRTKEEAKAKDIERQLEIILDKERKLFNYKYIVQLEDGNVELAREDDVEIVSDNSIIRKAIDV